VHGISITGQGDRDEMGLCRESPQFVTGLACMPNGTRCLGRSVRFERYERQMAWGKHSGMANRPDAGDLDVTLYSARNWVRLALAGNPGSAAGERLAEKEAVRTALGKRFMGPVRWGRAGCRHWRRVCGWRS
jgi:hypothetical protein